MMMEACDGLDVLLGDHLKGVGDADREDPT
jgi:hypothetical protein